MAAETVRLFKFSPAKAAWDLHSASVNPRFFDSNEDAATAKASWHIEAGEAEALVKECSFEEAATRVTFTADDSGIWALRFPSTPAFRAFADQYNGYLFENTYGVPNDEKHREKVGIANN